MSISRNLLSNFANKIQGILAVRISVMPLDWHQHPKHPQLIAIEELQTYLKSHDFILMNATLNRVKIIEFSDAQFLEILTEALKLINGLITSLGLLCLVKNNSSTFFLATILLLSLCLERVVNHYEQTLNQEEVQRLRSFLVDFIGPVEAFIPQIHINLATLHESGYNMVKDTLNFAKSNLLFFARPLLKAFLPEADVRAQNNQDRPQLN